MFKFGKRFHMEALETRQMMAGDVGAYLMNGNLYINEAAGQAGLDNGVRVASLPNGMTRVMGAENNGDGSTSLVNGAEYQDFMVPGDLIVRLGGGNDRLHLGFDGSVGAPSFNNVQINMSAPEPMLTRNFSYRISPGTIFDLPDDDQVFGWGFQSRGWTTIATGRGEDWVFLGRATIGDGAGLDNLSINSGAGSDSVSLKGTTVLGNLSIQTYSHVSENDGDQVWFNHTFDGNFNLVKPYIAGTTNVRMGGGADNFFIGDPLDDQYFAVGIQAIGSLTLDTGAGDDVIDVTAAAIGDATHASNLTIYTGAGADDITIDFSSSLIELGDTPPELKGNLYLQTYASVDEADADIVRIPLAQIVGDIDVRLGAGADNFNFFAGNWGQNITVDAGAGNDTGYLGGFVWHEATIRMGEGADNLELGHVNADILTLDGGNGGVGSDRLRKTQVLAVDHLFQSGWEYINGFPTWWNDIVWQPKNGGVLAP